MKRLNPLTKKEFQRGDIREDGYIFWSYQPSTIIKKTGYYKEKWYSKSAIKALQLKHKNLNIFSRTTVHGRAVRLLSNCKRRAKKLNLSFDLTLTDIESKISLGVCELSKLPFDFSVPKNSYTNPYAPSVDRIDNSKGYTKDNIRVVLSSINIALNDHGLKTMLPIFESLLKNTISN